MAYSGTITVTIADAPQVCALLQRAEAEITTVRALLLHANEALACALSTPQCPSRNPATGGQLAWYTQARAAEAAIRQYLAAQAQEDAS